MKKVKQLWEDELYVDPRPLNEDEKKAIADFIKNHRTTRTNTRSVKTKSQKSKKKIKA